MSEQNQPQESEEFIPDGPLTGHCYDGIEEYDNPLPGWWTWIFVATIVYSLGYFWIYHGGLGARRLPDLYNLAVADNLRLQFADLGELQPESDVILKYARDDKWVMVGKTVYDTNCISCHGAQAQGLVGPNLTDPFWKQVKEPQDVAKVIREGAAGGAMPAWKNRLHPNEVVLAASYIVSLQGTVPPGVGRKPEGTQIEPWSAGEIGSTETPESTMTDRSRG